MVSKENLVEEFVAITGTNKDTALHMLEACANNLEFAVSTYLDNGYQQNSTANGSLPVGEEQVRAPIPQTQGVLVEEFEPIPRRNPHHARSVFGNFSSNFEDSSSKGNKKLKKLEELFRPPYDIIHEGTFKSAREEAVKSNQWLMVNIQNAGEFSCQTLNRDVWSDKRVKDLIKKHFIFWQEPNDSREGDWYLTFYTVKDWPHVDILDPRTGGRLLSLSDITKENIIETINIFLADHGAHLDSETPSSKSSKEDIFKLNEEEQMAVAIAASLREVKTEKSDSNDDMDDSDLSQPESDIFSTARPLPDTNSTVNSASHNKVISNDSLPKKKTLKKIFLKPKKRKLSSFDDDNLTDFTRSKVFKMPTKDENNDFVLAPEYPANKLPSIKLSCAGSSNSTDSGMSSQMRLLLKHSDGHREEITLPARSKIKDLTLLVSKKYDLSTHELIKNFPRKNLSLLHGEFLLEEAGVFPKDTIFIQEKL